MKSDIGYSGIGYTIFLFKFPILSRKKEIVSFYTVCRPLTDIYYPSHLNLQFEVSFVHWRVIFLFGMQHISKCFLGLIHVQPGNNFPAISALVWLRALGNEQ